MSRKYVLSVEEFAEAIGVSVTTAYRMLADGNGPPFERWLEGGDDETKPIAQ